MRWQFGIQHQHRLYVGREMVDLGRCLPERPEIIPEHYQDVSACSRLAFLLQTETRQREEARPYEDNRSSEGGVFSVVNIC